MSATRIGLEESQANLLRAIASEQGRSLTAVTREAIQEYLARRGKLPPVRPPARSIPEAEWQSSFGRALERIRASIDPCLSPEQIEAEIGAARDEVRNERRVNRGGAGA